MSLFKRLFGPDEPEEAPDGKVAIDRVVKVGVSA